MPRSSYINIIIIVTNVFILEFLSARFVNPGALLPFYFFNTLKTVEPIFEISHLSLEFSASTISV